MFASKDLFFSKPSGYQISRSVRLRSSASAYFNRTPASATNRKTFTWSGWVKRGALSDGVLLSGGTIVNGVSENYTAFYFSGDSLLFLSRTTTNTLNIVTAGVFRDPSAWYHIILYVDTTQATNTNGVRIYVNGVQQTLTYTTYTQNSDTFINTTTTQNIGRFASDAYAGTFWKYLDGYMTEVNFIDGQALTPSSFGQTNTVTGVWQPLKYTGTYGTNGFYLNFSDNSNNTATTIGKDYSGNGNNWTPNNISVTAGTTYDSMLDVPTLYADGGNGRGNYAVLNPLQSAVAPIYANQGITASATNWYAAVGTLGISSGKWYWEISISTFVVGSSSIHLGIVANNFSVAVGNYIGSTATSYAYRMDGNKYSNNTATAYGASYTQNDVIGVALDLDAGTITFYKNNTSQGTAFSGITGEVFPAVSVNVATTTVYTNFGQRPFAYTPPTGFVALNTQNLPTPTISNGANYMAATTYTGTGSALTIANTVNGISFQPDFVWVKGRSGATDHALYDSVRGTTKDLVSNSTAAETTQVTGLTAFGSTGFTVGALAKMNTNAATYVGWQWLAGTTSSSNTSGSITSTVSVGATQGFSVVTWTSQASGTATVGHGLGVAPKLIISKDRDAVSDWAVYSSSIGATQYLLLNTTLAATTSSSPWNNTAPTSTVFTTGIGFATAHKQVAYCFSEVAGYSKFGSYTGNGSTDGPFVFCGFRPRWVLIKCSSTGGAGYEWELVDTSRNTSNVTNLVLYPNLSDAEATAGSAILDITSNGFKLRGGANIINASSATYIFAVFAENPFKYSLAR